MSFTKAVDRFLTLIAYVIGSLLFAVVLSVVVALSIKYLTLGGTIGLAVAAYVLTVALTSRKIGRLNPETGEQDLYLQRWYLTPRLFGFRFFLHNIIRSDDDKWPHSHPWPYRSLILWGKYIEHIFYPNPNRLPKQQRFNQVQVLKHQLHATPGTLLSYPATHTHKLEIVRPVWSLVLAGTAERDWGFWVLNETGPDQFIQWQEYLGIPRTEEKHEEDRLRVGG